eukprot:COSAG01_NODE_59955_length_297_cov_0.787879_1_plen_72_part_00
MPLPTAAVAGDTASTGGVGVGDGTSTSTFTRGDGDDWALRSWSTPRIVDLDHGRLLRAALHGLRAGVVVVL